MRKLVALVLLAASALPASANTLYKAVDGNGTVMFSDTPPEGARIPEQRVIGATAAPSAPEPVAGAPVNGLEEAYGLIDSDAALAQANARLDTAERALAQARRGAASRTEGLRLPHATPVSITVSSGHVENCKRDVKLARHALLDLLRSRSLATGRAPKG